MNINFKKFNYYAAITVLLVFTTAVLAGCAESGFKTASDTEFILDTVCTVSVIASNNAETIVSAAFDTAKDIQSKIDYFDECSTVSKFNTSGANEPVTLDDDTFCIIKCALDIAQASNGAFDITVAPITDLWDFKAENPAPPSDVEITSALRLVNYRSLILDEENKTLTKTTDGVKINLGGCGKGYICEKIINQITEQHPEAYAIIDLGGNTGICGSNPKNKDGHSTIGIQEPFEQPGVYKHTVNISSGQSAVTSGTYQRYFEYDGKYYHHIINPKNGYPAETNKSSVTIISDSSLLADCLSTACFVLGEDYGSALAEKYGTEIIWI